MKSYAEIFLVRHVYDLHDEDYYKIHYDFFTLANVKLYQRYNFKKIEVLCALGKYRYNKFTKNHPFIDEELNVCRYYKKKKIILHRLNPVKRKVLFEKTCGRSNDYKYIVGSSLFGMMLVVKKHVSCNRCGFLKFCFEFPERVKTQTMQSYYRGV